jgi:hypothetical protein
MKMKTISPLVFTVLLTAASGLAPLIASAQTLPKPLPGKGTLPAPTPAAPAVPVSPKTVPAETIRQRQLVRAVGENVDNIKSQGNFGAQLWLVIGRQFFEDWRKPETPAINPVEIVPRGQTAYTAIIFYGISRDQGGLGSVAYNIVVKRPDGSVFDQRNDVIGWQNLAPSDEKQLMLGRDSMSITIGQGDPAGLYTVDVTVRDNVSRVELPLRQHFVVQ